MKERVYVTICQVPMRKVQEEKYVFHHNSQEKLVEKSQEIYGKIFPNQTYPKQMIEGKIAQLLQTVSVEKHIEIKVATPYLDISTFLEKLTACYPYLIWTKAAHLTENDFQIFYFEFIPLAIKEEGFPFTFSLLSSLTQQGVEGSSDVLNNWRYALTGLTVETLNVAFPQLSQQEGQGAIAASQHSEVEEVKSVQPSVKRDLTQQKESVSKPEQIKQESSKLDQADSVRQLPSQVTETAVNDYQTNSFQYTFLNRPIPFVERKPGWHKKIKITLKEYDELHQKAKYVEYLWLNNQRRIMLNKTFVLEKKYFNQQLVKRERTRLSNKEIELFVLMDESSLIQSRVKVRKGNFFQRPAVKLLKNDYENLLNKSQLFDLLKREAELVEG